MRFSLLFVFWLLLTAAAAAQDSLSFSAIKVKIDSVRTFIYTGPSADLLPPEFNEAALENEYYCDRAYLNGLKLKGQISVLRFRNNHTVIYETFYKPYDYARIQYYIGSYHISNDTIYIKYRSLLEGKEGQIYVSPILPVSWIPPAPPAYLLLNKENLSDLSEPKASFSLAGKPQFIFESHKQKY